MNPQDALATSMLVFFAFAFGVLFTIFITMARNAGKKDDLEELRKHLDLGDTPRDKATRRKKKKSQKPTKKRDPWEKDPDWWQGED